ncbi:MAG: DUF4293 domain-containing protein [Prevotella sp.]|nr:DUF4293 domain-containing protein [Prevotella sp.]
MIQRKQTLFLLMAVVLTVICMSTRLATLVSQGIPFGYLYNLWVTNGQGQHAFTSAPLFVVLLLSALLSLTTIFLYTKRKLQASMCLLIIVLNIIWYVLLAVMPQLTGGEMVLEWPAVLPAISIILSFMARKGILADEKLVRSLDRIR